MLLKVGSKTDATVLAKSIAGYVHSGTERLGAISVGAGAVNQAVKAIAIARGFVASSGIELTCVPSFKTIQIDGNDVSAMIIDIIY